MPRPTYKEENSKRMKVLNMLPSDGSPVRWIDIEKQARRLGMSLTTVRKRLNEFEQGGRVKREVVATRPPGVYYSKVSIDAKIPYKFPPKACFDVNSWLEELEEVSKLPKNQRELFLSACLKYFLNFINMQTIASWLIALKGGNGEKFFEIMQSIYVTPTVQGISRLCRTMKDIAPDVLNELTKKQGDEMTQKLNVHLKIPIPSHKEGSDFDSRALSEEDAERFKGATF